MDHKYTFSILFSIYLSLHIHAFAFEVHIRFSCWFLFFFFWVFSCSDCSDVPCLMFKIQNPGEIYLEKLSYILANMIYPVLLETIVKGTFRSFLHPKIDKVQEDYKISVSKKLVTLEMAVILHFVLFWIFRRVFKVVCQKRGWSP